jgi:gluconate:H+ symporter, GntP family
MATLIPPADVLGYHPVYIACAIGWGAQCGNWMNDSGFWIFAKMGGLTETETLKTWTVTVSSTAVIGLLVTLLFATILPLT